MVGSLSIPMSKSVKKFMVDQTDMELKKKMYFNLTVYDSAQPFFHLLRHELV